MLDLAIGICGDENILRFEIRVLWPPPDVTKGHARLGICYSVALLAGFRVVNPDFPIFTRRCHVLVLVVELHAKYLGVRRAE